MDRMQFVRATHKDCAALVLLEDLEAAPEKPMKLPLK